MRKLTKSLTALLLALVIIVSYSLPVFSAETAEAVEYSDTYNSGTRDEDCESLDGTGAEDYYTDGEYDSETLSVLDADALLAELRELMTSTHTTTTKYADCRDMATKTDCQNADGESVVLIYTSFVANMQLYTANTSGGWNREHVWPQSLGGFGESGGGADLHHVRPSDSSINSSRGNKLYGEVTNPTGTSTGNKVTGGLAGGTYDSTYFEPHDSVKGDVARICLYVYVRWGASYPGYCDDITNVFQSIDVLLDWCALDPVDTWEMGRNEVVEAIQGNRNVFIDYPEYAWLIFDRDVPKNITTPSGLAEEIGVEGCMHKNTESRNQIASDCVNEGYTGDVYCIDCGKMVSKGSTSHRTDTHSFGQWAPVDSGYERVCSVCGMSEKMTTDSALEYIDSDAEKILILLSLGMSDSILIGKITE